MNETAASFARVVVPSPLWQPLTYAVPAVLRDLLLVGSRVLIPLGRRKLSGIVVEFPAAAPGLQTKEILAVLDDRPALDGALIRLLHWTSQYYLAPVGEVLTAILPPGLRPETEQWLRLRVKDFAGRDPQERQIIQLLRQRNGSATVKFLARQMNKSSVHSSLVRLEAAGIITRRERVPGARRRKAIIESGGDAPAGQELHLTEEQERAYRAVARSIDAGTFETFLLHGVTGSGKTEVYLRAMQRSRELGRRSLILIPEISLTPQLIDRVTGRFPGRVGVLHSGLTGAQRWSQWWNILRGDVDVVVGARSAIFAPLPDLGLIIVDEEHDPSYKQEEGLRYNGRDIAVVRGKISGCPVLLGSATPAIESYENCRQGRYRLLEISQRVNARPLPKIEIVDLREQPWRPRNDQKGPAPIDAVSGEPDAALALFSAPLAGALKDNFTKKRQSLIFINRRGFSNFLQCRFCGHVLRCSYCSVTLTVHLKQRHVRCHHCDFHKPITQLCPGCGKQGLAGIGAGTEQIEEALKRLLPDARVARMDRDTTSKRGSQETLIRKWEKGELDVLVGTQMITKGHDVMGVTLVGALLADLSLNLPDFRAAERTFQLLSQVAGRSGRGDDPGLMIVQTYGPDHYAIQHLLTHDYKGFFNAEIEFRRALSYPPFSRLVQLRVDGPKPEEVEGQIKQLAVALRRQLSTQEKFASQIEILGPAAAPIEKLRNRYRWQLLIKGKQIGALLEFAQLAREALPRGRSVRLHVDVDPYSML